MPYSRFTLSKASWRYWIIWNTPNNAIPLHLPMDLGAITLLILLIMRLWGDRPEGMVARLKSSLILERSIIRPTNWRTHYF